MRLLPYLSLPAAFLMITACNEAPAASAQSAASQAPSVTQAPVLSKAKSPNIALKTDVLTAGLKAPWNLAFLPNGDALITEKLGGIIRLSPSGTTTPIAGAPKAYTGGQGGVFDILLAPDFADSAVVYISYSAGDAGANGTAITKARLKGNALVDSEVIFMSAPLKDTRNHFGGRMVFMPDGALILTTGDGFSYREKAQDRSSHLGKVLRLTANGKAAGGNPFAGEPDAAKEVYSYGHRNVQGLAYDEVSGALWSHEHGPKGGDELNLTLPGRNYGWPIATFGIDYNGAQISPFETYEGMTDSVYYWKPSIAPSGMMVYRGQVFADMNGDIFIGGLASRDLRRLHMQDGRVIQEDIWLDDLGERIRDVQTGPDGAIYVLTDDKTDGKLIRITPG